MRIAIILALAWGAVAQQAPFTLEQALGPAFPSDLAAAPSGGKVAWVSNARGVRNIMVAEPPRYQARAVTAYTADDGQELGGLRWTPDASSLVYVRGQEAGRAGEPPNPTHDPHGAVEAVWAVAPDGSAPGAPRKLGEGDRPAIAPRGGRVAFVHRGKIWWAPLDGSAPAAPLFQAQGQCGQPVWSPDGARLAFTSNRGDHGFIGVYDVAAGSLRYVDPSTDTDLFPEWSPDGGSIAFVRIPGDGLRPVREAHRASPPWSVRVASVETGAGREVWRAREGRGSVFREVGGGNPLRWAAGGRLVFPWEGDGWTHLYSVAVAGGEATRLTPGEFEVEEMNLAAGGREVVFSSNQGDIDRRHLWKVAIGGGQVVPLTDGQGLEFSPVPLGDGDAVAFLRSDAERPLRAAIRAGGQIRDLDPAAIPADFPAGHMVAPQPVIFPAADGLALHGQLFLPPGGLPPGGAGGRRPAVVFFHGGSRRQMLLGWHSMYYYANAYALNQYLASSGYVVLSINYRSGIGYGMEFREALHYGASGGSEYNDVQGAGVYLRSRADVDPARIGVWGGSYGGYLVAMALARASSLFKAGVDFHGVHNWATELGIPPTAPDYQLAFDSSPMAFVKDWRSPVLLIQGDDDPDVQFNQTVMLAGALRKQKVDVEELIFPDEVHDFLLYRSWLAAYHAAAEFLKRKL
jgi:dipeptidyl aminopeptidase/acylaminoacyl peptidase